MLARTLVIAAMMVLAYYLYRRWLKAKQAVKDRDPTACAMKRCAHCDLHLPETEAICHHQLYFCSEDHKMRYLQEHH